ncbi:MAG: VWA domain-containing protein [Planctomycetes bacterium]|nr:VWA domain-containing protein [Planctomycetota bacterium]
MSGKRDGRVERCCSAARALLLLAVLGAAPVLCAAEEERTFFVLDRSASMARAHAGGASSLMLQRDAVAALVASLPATQRVGIASFASGARVDLSMRALATEADRRACIDAAGALEASGASQLGDGLDAALAALRSAGPPRGTESIVLLTDGGDAGSARGARDAVLPELVARGVRVFAFPLDAGADLALLAELASRSGGRSDEEESEGARTRALAHSTPRLAPVDLLASFDARLSAGETHEHRALVEQGASAVIFAAATPTRADAFELELVGPNRVVLRSTSQIPGVQFVQEGALRLFRIGAPAAGEWRLRLRGGASWIGLRRVRSEVLVQSATRAGLAWIDGPASVSPPALHRLRALAQGFDDLLQQPLEAELLDSEGLALARFELRDGGSALDGDALAGDGIHSAWFGGWSGSGRQHVRVKARGIAGGRAVQRCAELRLELLDERIPEPSFLQARSLDVRAREGADEANRLRLELDFDLAESGIDPRSTGLALAVNELEIAIEASAWRSRANALFFEDETRRLELRPAPRGSSRVQLALDWRAFDGADLGELGRIELELELGELVLAGALLPRVDARGEVARWSEGEVTEGLPWQIVRCDVDRRRGTLSCAQRLERDLFDPTSDPLELLVEGWGVHVPAGALVGGPRRYFFEVIERERALRLDLDLATGLLEVRGQGLGFFGAPSPLDLGLGVGARSGTLRLRPAVAGDRARY